MSDPTWEPLSRRSAARVKDLMLGTRGPLERFLSPEPPRELPLQQDFGAGLSALDGPWRAQIDAWSATRAWITDTRSIPDHESPILEIDLVFFVDDTPVAATIRQNNDGIHWAGSQRTHHDWFHALMRSKGDRVTVLYERTERRCALFGDMCPYIYKEFAALLEEIQGVDDPDDRRNLLYEAIDLVWNMEDKARVRRAVDRFNRSDPAQPLDAWYSAAAECVRLGDPILPRLERMLPDIAREGRWFWAAV